jgi:hypothetical protein
MTVEYVNAKIQVQDTGLYSSFDSHGWSVQYIFLASTAKAKKKKNVNTLDTLVENISILNARLDAVLKDNSILNARLDAVLKDNTAVKDENRTFRREINRLSDEVGRLNEENVELRRAFVNVRPYNRLLFALLMFNGLCIGSHSLAHATASCLARYGSHQNSRGLAAKQGTEVARISS